MIPIVVKLFWLFCDLSNINFYGNYFMQKKALAIMLRPNLS